MPGMTESTAEKAFTEAGGFRRLKIQVGDRIGAPAEQISLFLARRQRKKRSPIEFSNGKKDRRGKPKFPAAPPPENRIILPRPAEERGQGLMGPFNYGNLQRQRERYLISAVHVAQPPPESTVAICAVCSSAGGAAGFHFCVHDRVLVEAFRSPAGPIRRPHPNPRS
ncbi:uncharacterized protein LOC144705429 [Wolffia australiana]